MEPDTAERLPLPPDTLSHHADVVSRSGRTVGVRGLGRGNTRRGHRRRVASRLTTDTAHAGKHSTDPSHDVMSLKHSGKGARPSTKGTSVCGARRIWGTLRATTTRAVERAISTFSTIPINNLIVKRKYKSLSVPGSMTKKSQRWWFVVRAEESELVQLEKDWVSIEVQTGWQLTPLLHYVAVANDVSAVDDHQSASHNDKQLSTAEQPNNEDNSLTLQDQQPSSFLLTSTTTDSTSPHTSTSMSASDDLNPSSTPFLDSHQHN